MRVLPGLETEVGSMYGRVQISLRRAGLRVPVHVNSIDTWGYTSVQSHGGLGWATNDEAKKK